MPRPTRVARDWFLTRLPTMGLPHGGGGSAMPLFSTMVATQLTSLMRLLNSYWPMAFVLGATRGHRILQEYGIRRLASASLCTEAEGRGDWPSRVQYWYTAVYLRVHGRILEVYGSIFAMNIPLATEPTFLFREPLAGHGSVLGKWNQTSRVSWVSCTFGSARGGSGANPEPPVRNA